MSILSAARRGPRRAVLVGLGVAGGLVGGLGWATGWGLPGLRAAGPATERTPFFVLDQVPRRPAPELDLADLAGRRVRLADLRGRVVLVNLWATWCAPCRREMPALEALGRELGPRGLVVLGVNHKEDADTARAFVAEVGLTFPVLLDPEGAVAERYRASGIPVTYLIDPEGRLAATAVGYREWEGPMARAYLQVLLGTPAHS